MKLAILSLGVIVLAARVDLNATILPLPDPVPLPPRPAACDLALALDSVLPNPTQGDAERVTLINRSALPIDLEDWVLWSGRRSHRLSPGELAPGGTCVLAGPDLGSLRLRNRDGDLRLLDPCGAERDHVTWAQTQRGVAIDAEHPTTGQATPPTPELALSGADSQAPSSHPAAPEPRTPP